MSKPSPIPPFVVALSYFNKLIGPSTLYVYPRGVVQDEVLREVTSVIDKVSTPGFFMQSSNSYTSINDYFELPSPWARGAKELLLLSFIFPSKISSEAELVLQCLAQEIETQIIKTPEIYKGFYIADANRYPEGDRVVIQEMHQQLLSLMTHLHQIANKTLFDTWMLHMSEELLPGSLLNNPILTATCTGHGLEILAAVAYGAKTRHEAAKRAGITRRELTQRLPLLLSMDLLTEGLELVLTHRGRKILEERQNQESPVSSLPRSLISTIKQGVRTLEELHSALQGTMAMTISSKISTQSNYSLNTTIVKQDSPGGKIQ